MKSKLFLLFVVLALAVFGVYAFAKNDDSQMQVQVQLQDGSGEVQVQNEDNATGNQLELKDGNEIKSNVGGLSGEKESDEITSEDSTGTDKEIEKAEPVRMAEQVRSEVANAVQAMLQVADRSGGIGQEIKVVAQLQNENQLKIENSIKKIEGRGAVAKFIIGPDYGEIDNAQQILEQNKEKVSELNKIKIQLASQIDQQKLADQISVLEKANVQVEASLNQTEKGFSLLGWLFKILP